MADDDRAGAVFGEVIVGVAAATAAAAVPFVGGDGPSIALAAAAGAAAAQPLFLSVVRHFTQNQLAAFARSLVRQIKTTDDISEEEIAGIIENWIEERESRRELIVSAVRRVLDDVDTAALRPLANLVIRYRDQVPDSVFRATARLIAQLSEAELDDLRRLVNWALENTKRDDLTITTHDSEQSGGEWRKLGAWRTEMLRDEFVGRRDGTQAERHHELLGLSDPFRLFQLLKVNTLGFDGHGMAFDSGPGKIWFRRSVLEHLAAVLGPG